MTQPSSASRVAGKTYRTFDYQGKTYLLSQPLRFASYSDEESLVLWKRRLPDEFGMRMIARLPASYHAAIWQGCAAADMRGIPSEEEWAAYNGSPWRAAYRLWSTLDPKHKVDRETKEPIDLIAGVQWSMQVVQSLNDDERHELFMKIAIVSQDADIKNSSGRTAPAAPASEQSKESPNSTECQPSMNTSPSDLDTDPMK